MEYFVGRPALEPYRIRRFEWIGKGHHLFKPNWSDMQGSHVFGNAMLAFIYSVLHGGHMFSLSELESVLDDHMMAQATKRSLEHRGLKPATPPPLKKKEEPMPPPPPAGKV